MRPLIFASLQPELAEAKGVPLRFVSTAFLAIVALAVSECAQIVGVLLVFTLMVGPPAAAQRITSGLWSGLAASAALALAEAWLGITIAYHTDWPVSFCIALLSGLVISPVSCPCFGAPRDVINMTGMTRAQPDAAICIGEASDRTRARRRRTLFAGAAPATPSTPRSISPAPAKPSLSPARWATIPTPNASSRSQRPKASAPI